MAEKRKKILVKGKKNISTSGYRFIMGYPLVEIKLAIFLWKIKGRRGWVAWGWLLDNCALSGRKPIG